MNEEMLDDLELYGLDDELYQRIDAHRKSTQYDGDSYRLCNQDLLEYSLNGVSSINIRD
jgi:hypothetical protein